MSHLCDEHPLEPERNRRALSRMRTPGVRRLLRRLYQPYECYRFFDIAFPGFSAPVRDLRRSDVTDRAAKSIRRRLSLVTPAHRDSLVVKFTGWPRIGFLAEIFPEAQFIHLVRDGRAVANSLMQVSWWHGWRGPENWRFGPLPDHYREEWNSHDQSFTALAAIEWKLVMDAVEASRDEIRPERLLEIRYEDLCAEPYGMMERILAHCGVESSATLKNAMRRDPLRSRNARWREDLGPANAEILDSVLAGALGRFGYAE